MATRIYRFSKDYCTKQQFKDAKTTLGGKGAGLRMMAQQGLNVPPGFTITTETCNEYRSIKEKAGQQAADGFLNSILDQCVEHLDWLRGFFGYPPLVSVRSGAPVSMPGMMDTILNVGLTNGNMAAWQDRIGTRSAWDSMRRLIQMLGSTGYGVSHSQFEKLLQAQKNIANVQQDTELSDIHLMHLSDAYQVMFEKEMGKKFPINNATEQLRVAIKAVFESWMNPRAIEYRKLNKIDESMGTAVNVQAMVFGNMGEDSGTGVLFTRNPSTGENKVMGEFLTNAQGEDVVAGIRTPVNLTQMAGLGPMWAGISQQLLDLSATLEEAYKDMVDVEFTIQQGTLFVLQSRTGKRSARAAFKIATDLVAELAIPIGTALKRLTKEQFKVVRRPSIDPKFKTPANMTGLPACPGVAVGRPVFSSKDAVEAKDEVVLVTHETTPDDISGMHSAVGILTKTGGATSHAAVVARAMDKTCVVGCTELDLLWIAENVKKVVIDGATGKVWFDVDVPVLDSSDAPEIAIVSQWCLEAIGGVEAVVVPVAGKKQCVMAAHWWGDAEVMNAVLEELKSFDSLDGVILDLSRPTDRLFDPDRSLLDVFGTQVSDKLADDGFTASLYARLYANAKELKGLTLINEDGSESATLEANGFNVTSPVFKAVPADYAVFMVLVS